MVFVYHLCLSCYIMLYHASRRTFFYYIKPRSQQIDWTSLRSFGAKKAIEWKNNFHGECELNHVRCRCTFLGIQTLQMNKCVIFFFKCIWRNYDSMQYTMKTVLLRIQSSFEIISHQRTHSCGYKTDWDCDAMSLRNGASTSKVVLRQTD